MKIWNMRELNTKQKWFLSYFMVLFVPILICVSLWVQMQNTVNRERINMAYLRIENLTLQIIIESDITIIGCSGRTHELFDNSLLSQTDTTYEGVIQETCVTVTWIKVCNQLLCLTQNSQLADNIELSVYNALLGAVNTDECKVNGGLPFDSYSPLLPQIRGRKTAGRRDMENGTTFYGCCAAIGSAGLGLIPLASVMASYDGLSIQLYIVGTVKAKTPLGNPVTLNIQTDYPISGKIKIGVDVLQNEEFSLYLRIPQSSHNTSVMINGKKIKSVRNGQYLKVKKVWNNYDVIDIELDVRTHVVKALESEKDPMSEFHVSLKRGALILARDARFGIRKYRLSF